MIPYLLLGLFCQAPAVPDAVRLANELDRKSEESFLQGRLEEAAGHQKQALRLWEEIARTHPMNLAVSHLNLAQIFFAQGKLHAAEAEASLARELGAGAHVGRIKALSAKIYFELRDYVSAERELREAVADLAGVELATALNDLGYVAATLGRLPEGRRLMEESLALRERTGAAAGPNHGRMMGNLALVCFRQGDLAAAAEHYREAIRILEVALGSNHIDVGMLLAEYGQVLRRTGSKSEAKAVERRARTILAAAPRRQTVDVRSLR